MSESELTDPSGYTSIYGLSVLYASPRNVEQKFTIFDQESWPYDNLV